MLDSQGRPLTDHKAQRIIANLHTKIVSGNFDEMDASNLLINLREPARKHDKTNPVVELADFIAHRERDRGHIHRYVLSTRNSMQAYARGEPVSFRIAPVFSEAELCLSLNRALTARGLTPLTDEQANQVLLAVVLLLQRVPLVDRQGTQFGTLTATFKNPETWLQGFVEIEARPGVFVNMMFPALIIRNRFYPILEFSNPVAPTAIASMCVTNGKVEFDDFDPYWLFIQRTRFVPDPKLGFPVLQGTDSPVQWHEVEIAVGHVRNTRISQNEKAVDVLVDGDWHEAMFFWESERGLAFHGHPDFFLQKSPIWRYALEIKRQLNANVIDGCRRYCFFEYFDSDRAVILESPPGTVIYQYRNDELIRDPIQDKHQRG